MDLYHPERIRFRHHDTRLIMPPAIVLHPPIGSMTEATSLTYHQIGLKQTFFKSCDVSTRPVGHHGNPGQRPAPILRRLGPLRRSGRPQLLGQQTHLILPRPGQGRVTCDESRPNPDQFGLQPPDVRMRLLDQCAAMPLCPRILTAQSMQLRDHASSMYRDCLHPLLPPAATAPPPAAGLATVLSTHLDTKDKNHNSYLDSITQKHPECLVHRTPAPATPETGDGDEDDDQAGSISPRSTRAW